MRTSNVTSSVSERRMATTGKAFRKLLVFKKILQQSSVRVSVCTVPMCAFYLCLSLSLSL